MPSHRYNDAYHGVFDGVLFQMTDGNHRIVYRITHEALQDRAAADGEGCTLDMVEIFLKHRAEIGDIAIDKYEAGNTERLVRTADLNVPPHATIHDRLRSNAE